MIPAEPHLERHRHAHRSDRRLDQSQRMIEIAHQRRTGLTARDVARRAAHVDVDDIGAGRLRAARKLGRIDCAIVPSKPHLERDGHGDRADGRLDQSHGMRDLPTTFGRSFNRMRLRVSRCSH